MSVQYLPPRTLPDGYRDYADVVRETAKENGWASTGWHYGYEPPQSELEYKARVHEKCDVSNLKAVFCATGNPKGWDQGSWHIFRLDGTRR